MNFVIIYSDIRRINYKLRTKSFVEYDLNFARIFSHYKIKRAQLCSERVLRVRVQ